MNRCTRKRTLLMVVLLLTGGAIINVAVAWAVLIQQVQSSQRKLMSLNPFNSLPTMEIETAVVRLRNSYNAPAGRPYSSLERAVRTTESTESGSVWCNGFWLRGPAWIIREPLRLPVRPLWPGFAINTIFYASILWLFFAAPGVVRRRIRARRGQCPACAYPVGASDVCTECGRPVKNRQLAMGNRQ